jgi:putative endonuclease
MVYILRAFEKSMALFFILSTMGTFTVYILYSESADKYYIGHTADLKSRLLQHNDAFVDTHATKFTLKNGPWKLVYSEDGFATRSEAMKREREIKGWKSRVMIQKLVSAGPGNRH